jgi:hypothetical protein
VYEGSNFDVDRILNNILRCSLLVMSDCGLLLELVSSHHQGQSELFIICFLDQACVQITVMAPLLHDSLSPDATSVIN